MVDIDACHILLERPWKHDIDATHKGIMNIYMFNWNGKRVVMRSIQSAPRSTKEKGPNFISKFNRSEFLVESKETKQRFALLIKEITQPTKISEKRKPLLEEFKRVMHDELPDKLSPMRDPASHWSYSGSKSTQSFTLPDESQGEWSSKREG